MEVTPETATNWLEVVNTGGVVGVLLGIIVYGGWFLPKFLKRWGEHTTALVTIHNDLDNLKNEVRELRDDLNAK